MQTSLNGIMPRWERKEAIGAHTSLRKRGCVRGNGEFPGVTDLWEFKNGKNGSWENSIGIFVREVGGFSTVLLCSHMIGGCQYDRLRSLRKIKNTLLKTKYFT